jgi:hypothetical protein
VTIDRRFPQYVAIDLRTFIILALPARKAWRRGCLHNPNPWRPAIYRSPLAASGLSGPDAVETYMSKLLTLCIALAAIIGIFTSSFAQALPTKEVD